jgi:small subunit ribosomal protein S15
MALLKDDKAKLVTTYGKNERDTGTSEVQIAITTERINTLTEHFKKFPKDTNSRRGLLILVGQRKKLLKYLQRTDLEKYRQLIEKLNIRK